MNLHVEPIIYEHIILDISVLTRSPRCLRGFISHLTFLQFLGSWSSCPGEMTQSCREGELYQPVAMYYSVSTDTWR